MPHIIGKILKYNSRYYIHICEIQFEISCSIAVTHVAGPLSKYKNKKEIALVALCRCFLAIYMGSSWRRLAKLNFHRQRKMSKIAHSKNSFCANLQTKCLFVVAIVVGLTVATNPNCLQTNQKITTIITITITKKTN